MSQIEVTWRVDIEMRLRDLEGKTVWRRQKGVEVEEKTARSDFEQRKSLTDCSRLRNPQLVKITREVIAE